jgi:hypothetical protein
MIGKKTLSILLFGFALVSSLHADGAIPSKVEVPSTKEGLDAKIKELKQARAVAKMNAYLAGNQASREYDNNWLGYRQAVQNQEQYEQLQAQLDSQIAELEKQRAAIYGKPAS